MDNSKSNKLILLVVALLVLAGGAFIITHHPEIKMVEQTNYERFSDPTSGIAFKYPVKLPTKYITAVDWPPKVGTLNIAYTCPESGEANSEAGKTTQKTIDGVNYCVTVMSEGAAGSTYSQYAYATEIQNKFVFFTFSIRETQCGNYDEVEKMACEAERSSFNIDSVVHQIAKSVKMN